MTRLTEKPVTYLYENALVPRYIYEPSYEVFAEKKSKNVKKLFLSDGKARPVTMDPYPH
jgi:hypothetical protein